MEKRSTSQHKPSFDPTTGTPLSARLLCCHRTRRTFLILSEERKISISTQTDVGLWFFGKHLSSTFHLLSSLA
jgi:hypothetical protein